MGNVITATGEVVANIAKVNPALAGVVLGAAIVIGSVSMAIKMMNNTHKAAPST